MTDKERWALVGDRGWKVTVITTVNGGFHSQQKHMAWVGRVPADRSSERKHD